MRSVCFRSAMVTALLQPTVQVDARGSVSLSGQRGVNTGFTIDGANAKSAFFGFGRGGLAREGGGNLVAQESVREFQVVTSGYAAEAGRSGGGAVNVVTKSGTNEFSGSSFLFVRNHGMVSRLPRSPLDAARGVAVDDERYAVDEFRRYNWGASLGGPIRRDRTHFFLSYDQTAQDQPFLRDIRGRGQYDAVLTRFPELLAGFQPNDDGIAAADADRGRTASGQFVRGTDNLILFAKLNHRVNDRHSLILGYNFADYGRVSDFVGEESRRFVESHSVVGSLVSVVGERGVNELRFQHAYDHLDRSSHLPASTVQAGFQIFSPSFGSFGKPWWLPVFNHERNFEVRERFSLLSGNHEFRMGFTFSRDTLNEFFAGNADGSYDFDTVADFIAGRPARAFSSGAWQNRTSGSPSRFSAFTPRTPGARIRASRCTTGRAGTPRSTRTGSSTCSRPGGAFRTISTTSPRAAASSGRSTRGVFCGAAGDSSTPGPRRCSSPPPTPTPGSTRASVARW